MRYCHECGAEVAPDDTFCSFCGITLAPLPGAAQTQSEADGGSGALSAADEPATVIGNSSAPLAGDLPPSNAGFPAAPSSPNAPVEAARYSPFAETIEQRPSALPAADDEDADAADEPMTLISQPKIVLDAPPAARNAPPETAGQYFPAQSESADRRADRRTAAPPELAEQNTVAAVQPDERLIETIVAQDVIPAPEPPRSFSADDEYPEDLQPTLIGSANLFNPTPDKSESAPESQPENSAQANEWANQPTSQENRIQQPENQFINQENQPDTAAAQSARQFSGEIDESDLPMIKDSGNFPATTAENSDEFQSNAPNGFDNFAARQPENSGEFASGAMKNQPPPAADILGGDAARDASQAEHQPPVIAAAPNFPSESVAAVESGGKSAEPPRSTGDNKPQDTPGGKSPQLKPLEVGAVLNRRYEIVRRIGGGGMGAVYLAKDQNLDGKLRAVKEMIQAYVDESAQDKAVADFKRESVLLTSLEHSSIPTIYDYFFDEEAGRFYLVMKYISGGDLAARLRSASDAKLDEGSVTDWAIQIADVLEYLHSHEPPIVYRDLKPSNIMLDGSNNKAMLIDFGIARWVNKEEKGVTAVGTMGYAPPELFAGNAEPRSDIYSLGATMFHLLTGADPQNNPLLIFDFTKNKRPRQINPMLSVEMEDILLRAVEYNSGARFESAARMRDALREHLDRLRNGRLTFERKSSNLAQVMPIPAQAPPPVSFQNQPPVNMVFCGFCGEKIIGTDMFCAYCGAPQANSPNAQAAPGQMDETLLSYPAPVNPAPITVGAATARLVVIGTNELDAPVFPLDKDANLVGREDRRANIFPEVDLSKYDIKAQVSRRHAVIRREGAMFLVEDLKSSNGTTLISDDNRTVRLQANQPHVLQHGDKIKLGETTLRFYVN